MRYAVIKKENLKDLVKHINKVMKEGWEPIGGATHASRTVRQDVVGSSLPAVTTEYFYLQAIVKGEP